MVYSDNDDVRGGVVYPLLNPCHDVVGKTGLVVVAVQGAPKAPAASSFGVSLVLVVRDM